MLQISELEHLILDSRGLRQDDLISVSTTEAGDKGPVLRPAVLARYPKDLSEYREQNWRRFVLATPALNSQNLVVLGGTDPGGASRCRGFLSFRGGAHEPFPFAKIAAKPHQNGYLREVRSERRLDLAFTERT